MDWLLDASLSFSLEEKVFCINYFFSGEKVGVYD